MLVAVAIATTPVAVMAETLRESLNSVDFNDYALMFNYYQSQSPYVGQGDFRIIYPVVTTFEHSITTDNVYFVRDSYLGLRTVTDSGWKFGVTGKVQTLGYAADANPELQGMGRRSWSLQAGGVIGKRLGPVAVDLFATHDILNESGGWEAAFKLAWPLGEGRFSLIPQLDLTYQSGDLVDHYFGVEAAEARAGRPEYTAGSAWTWGPRVTALYRWHEHWYVRASMRADFLPGEISNSPIVARDSSLAFGLGIAYDSRAFVSLDDAEPNEDNFFEASVGAFMISSDTNIDFVGSLAQSVGDLEGIQRLDDQDLSWPIEIAWQMGRFHRLDLRYFALKRSGSVILDAPLTIADSVFSANEQLITRLDTRILRLSYAFSVFRDAQKEFSILGGVSTTLVDYAAVGDVDSAVANTNLVLPVIGASARISFTDKVAVEGRLEIFALDVDDKEGDMADLNLSGTYRFSPRLLAGIGYQLFRQNISSGDDSFSGDVRIDYRGPQVFLRAQF